MGLPGTSGFVGEFLAVMGTFEVNTWVAAVAATGVILSPAYALYLYRRVVFGDLVKAALKQITDMSWREKLVLIPLVATTLWFGVFPAAITDLIGPSVAAMVADHQTALLAADTRLAAQ
jgi:NADH-quinone oxidoreductase subunit M